MRPLSGCFTAQLYTAYAAGNVSRLTKKKKRKPVGFRFCLLRSLRVFR